MKPVVILDANAVHGGKPFTRGDMALLLNLARTRRIRLLIPEVVLHELSRQWAERLDKHRAALGKALEEVNSARADVGGVAVAVEVPAMSRVVFYEHAVALLRGSSVEIPPCPDLPVRDLLVRDLDVRKPFSREGKGFRDALIWETIRAVCGGIEDNATPILFLTNNSRDFCDEQGGKLHTDLRAEIPEGQHIEVVKLLKDLVAHEMIDPLAALLRVEDSLASKQVANLVDRTLSDLSGYDVDQVVGYYDDGINASPISTVLEDIAFNNVDPDNDTIEFEVFRIGDDDEMTLRVAVEGDCDIEGFIHKSGFLVHDGGFSYFEDWNKHMMRVIEPHRLRFMLSGDFTESTIGDLALTVDEIEDVEV